MIVDQSRAISIDLNNTLRRGSACLELGRREPGRRALSLLFILLTLFLAPSAQAQEVYDPWEGMNRGIFWVNNKVDINLIEPIAKGYRWVLPQRARTGVTNFFRNLGYPVYLVSDLIQLDLTAAGKHTARFVVNTTLGVGGLMDIAGKNGLKHEVSDFGLALARWGVPDGPYFVIPFVGPSNVRDTLGFAVDRFLLHPSAIIGYASDADSSTEIGMGLTALEVINTRARLVDAIQSARDASVDYYSFVQGAYQQSREHEIKGLTLSEDDEFEDDFTVEAD